tara:strand:- start:13871 stop:14257 length:387 start_codon:yes stop_codon:yes gene_type:complete
MAGQLDSLFKNVAKQIVSDLGTSLDTTISYIRKGQSSYDINTGKEVSVNTTFSDLRVPIEFIRSEDDLSLEIRQAKIYITPDLIGDNQPNKADEIILDYAGANRTAQIITIDTKKGGQTYLFTLLVRF